MATLETNQLLEVPLSSDVQFNTIQKESTNTRQWCSKWPFCTFRVRLVVVVAVVFFQLPVLLYYMTASEHRSWSFAETYRNTLVQRFFKNDTDWTNNSLDKTWNNVTTVSQTEKVNLLATTVSEKAQEKTDAKSTGNDNEAPPKEEKAESTTINALGTAKENTTTVKSSIEVDKNRSSLETTTHVTLAQNADKVVSEQTQLTTVDKTSTGNTTISIKYENNVTVSNALAADTEADEKTEINPSQETILPNCPEEPPNLQGRLRISFENPPKGFSQTQMDNPLVASGGHGKPPYCKAKWKVAVIIPYRKREEHLKYFVQYMHPILQRQQVDYEIFIINQAGMGKFNRAKLMNIGFLEALKIYPFDCFVYHDVDLVLEDDRSLYWCSDRPRHLSAGVDKFNYVLPYASIFGGVTMISKKQMEDINGFSNSFWGWGGEDDDVFNRLHMKGHKIIRYPMNIARYKMIMHKREKGNEANPKRFDLIRKTKATMDTDGLNSIDYELLSVEFQPLYTNITVDVKPPK